MTNRLMYDSTKPSLIPADVAMVAGYINGMYAWSQADWRRFPHAAHVRIDVTGADPFGSDVADVERGDLSIAGAVQWVEMRQRERGWWSCCYVDRSNLAELRDAMGNLHTMFWVADWTGVPHVVEGERICAVQYLSTSHYDVSEVFSPEWFPSPVKPSGDQFADAIAAQLSGKEDAQ